MFASSGVKVNGARNGLPSAHCCDSTCLCVCVCAYMFWNMLHVSSHSKIIIFHILLSTTNFLIDCSFFFLSFYFFYVVYRSSSTNHSLRPIPSFVPPPHSASTKSGSATSGYVCVCVPMEHGFGRKKLKKKKTKREHLKIPCGNIGCPLDALRAHARHSDAAKHTHRNANWKNGNTCMLKTRVHRETRQRQKEEAASTHEIAFDWRRAQSENRTAIENHCNTLTNQVLHRGRYRFGSEYCALLGGFETWPTATKGILGESWFFIHWFHPNYTNKIAIRWLQTHTKKQKTKTKNCHTQNLQSKRKFGGNRTSQPRTHQQNHKHTHIHAHTHAYTHANTKPHTTHIRQSQTYTDTPTALFASKSLY